jgi:hypothetical protein
MEFADMLAAGIPERTLKSWQAPVKISDPDDRRAKLFDYELLTDKCKLDIIAKFGNPYEHKQAVSISAYLVTDTKALAYYKSYRTGSGKFLPRNEKDENKDYPQALTKAATWLNVFIQLCNKELPLTKEEYAGIRADKYHAFREQLKKNSVKLPYTYEKLVAKKNQYSTPDGIDYSVLIPKKLENQNSRKAKGDMEILLKQIYGQNKVDMTSVAARFNVYSLSSGLTHKNGKPLTITPQTAANVLKAHKIQLDVMRNGVKSFHTTYRPIISRERPSTPLFMVAHDGWTVELYYQQEGDNGTNYWNRKIALVVVDPFNDYPLGFALGEQENKELMKEAYRNAMFHIRQLTGNYYAPHQIKCDNFGLDTKLTNDLAQFYINLLPGKEWLTPIEPGNSQDNPVESFFNRLNHCIQEKYSRWNWSGRGLTAKEQNQANREFLNANRHEFPTEAEMMVQFMDIINSIRAEKQQQWLEAFEAAPAQDKRMLTREQALEAFGVQKTRTVSLTNKSLCTDIDGKEYRFMLLDNDFYKYYGSSFTIKYDPYDMSDLLAICHEHRVQFVVPELIKSKMALRDMQEGDRIHLNRMLGFRKAMQAAIIERNGLEYNRVMSLPQTEQQAIAMAKVMPTIQGNQKYILNKAEQLLKGKAAMPQITTGSNVTPKPEDNTGSIYNLM